MVRDIVAGGASRTGRARVVPAPLDQEAIDLIERVHLGHVATVSPDGHPHVSPKGTVWALDGGEQVAFAHIHSHRTVEHLHRQPHLALSVTDIFERRGVLVQGIASVVGEGERGFSDLMAAYARRRGREPAGVHAFVVVDVSWWEGVWSPAYDDGTPREAVERRWRRFYQAELP